MDAPPAAPFEISSPIAACKVNVMESPQLSNELSISANAPAKGSALLRPAKVKAASAPAVSDKSSTSSLAAPDEPEYSYEFLLARARIVHPVLLFPRPQLVLPAPQLRHLRDADGTVLLTSITNFATICNRAARDPIHVAVHLEDFLRRKCFLSRTIHKPTVCELLV